MSVPIRFFLFKRNNGIYYIGYYDKGRRRWKSTSCTLKGEALRAVANLTDLLKKQPIRVTLSAFIHEFLLYAQATFSPSWVTIYRLAFRHLHSLVGDCFLSTLCMRNIDDYKTKRLAEVSAVSVNHELQALRAAMNVAVRWKHLEANPFAGVQLMPVPERIPLFFTKRDLAELLGVVREPWLKGLIIIGASTGMRRGELLNLRWTDVDLSRRLIQIQSHGTFKTKTGKRRVMPMSEVIFRLLA